MMQSSGHIPVLLREVMDILAPKAGERVLDVTLGLGGHSQAFFDHIGPTGYLTALDADTKNIAVAQKRLAASTSQLRIHHANFGSMAELDLEPFDIVFADLGLSSPHLDDPKRGFTFRDDAPLDMRYNQDNGKTAAQLIADLKEDDLADVFRLYGELYKEARKLANVLHGSQVSSTAELRQLVEQAFGFRAKHILPQVFQALRIAVNEELQVLGILLAEGPRLLKPGGRMGVISYHSLEDRIVKHSFRALCEPVKDTVTGQVVQEAPFALLTKKAIQPSDAEVTANPRSRSAKFRAILRRFL